MFPFVSSKDIRSVEFYFMTTICYDMPKCPLHFVIYIQDIPLKLEWPQFVDGDISRKHLDV